VAHEDHATVIEASDGTARRGPFETNWAGELVTLVVTHPCSLLRHELRQFCRSRRGDEQLVLNVRQEKDQRGRPRVRAPRAFRVSSARPARPRRHPKSRASSIPLANQSAELDVINLGMKLHADVSSHTKRPAPRAATCPQLGASRGEAAGSDQNGIQTMDPVAIPESLCARRRTNRSRVRWSAPRFPRDRGKSA